MDRYKTTFDTWDKLAELYQEKFMELDIYNHTYDFILNSLDTLNSEILEIGCGPGNITKYLLSKRPDLKIFGIDIASKMIALARKNNPTASFGVMDSRHINKLKSNYDAIICGFCLPYLSHKDSLKLISESYLLLNENGLIYLSFVEGDTNKSGFQVGNDGNKVYFYYHRLDELKNLLAINDFNEINVFQVEYKRSENNHELHTILTAKKKRC